MNLNRRQRSRSETRGAENLPEMQHLMRFKVSQQQQQQQQIIGNGARRKTSAELISEAKISLNGNTNHNNNNNNNFCMPKLGMGGSGAGAAGGGGGVRLVSTRRPVTPRESGRALYGNVALAGRPPSAFSMRYLQAENQRTTTKTPTLAPIPSTIPAEMTTPTTTTTAVAKRHSRRSHSLGSTVEFCKAFGGALHSFDVDSNCSNSNNNNNNSNSNNKNTNSNNGRILMAMPRKLPALEIAGLPLNAQGQRITANGQHAQRATNNKSQNENSMLVQTPEEQQDSALNLLSSRRLLKRNCDVLSQSTTQKLIELLKEHAGLKDCTEETANHVHSILVELYGRVRKQEKRCKRGFILGGLYGLVESTSPKILLAVAKVVLALRVTGSNLTGACKLIFKVARSEQNDNLFHDNDLLELLIEGLGRASPLDDPEACIYGYGAIRFLTSSSAQEREELTPNAQQMDKNIIRNSSNNNNNNNNQWWHTLKPATAPAGSGNGGSSNLLQQREQRWQRLCKQNTLVQRMARQGAVQLMVLHLQLLNEAGAMRKLCGPPLHSLYQLSAALRALADVRQTAAAAAEATESVNNVNGVGGVGVGGGSTAANREAALGPDSLQLQLACTHLVRAAEISIGELEVQANIVRTLSALSEDEDCCLALVSATGRIGMLLGPCCELFDGDGIADNKPLSVLSRLGYILGNLMAKYDQARIQFYRNDVAMEFLLNALTLCCSKPLTLRSTLGDSVLDVLVKLIRVVANMSVNAEVGSGLGGVRDLGTVLIGLLQTINERPNDYVKSSRVELQELTHATLGALHNLCFYQDDEQQRTAAPTHVTAALPGSLQRILPQLANALYATLRTAHDDVSVHLEAERVLGNLTRNAQARQYFCRSGGMSLMLQRLVQYSNDSDSNDENKEDLDGVETRACAIGVLVNLLGDEVNRAPFMRLNGMQHLLSALNGVLQQQDWRFAAIICQAFWNLLTDTTNNTTSSARNRIDCATHLLDELCDQLADHLDEESLFIQHNSTMHSLWEDFAVIAADLLERIQNTMEEQEVMDNEEMISSLSAVADNELNDNRIKHKKRVDDDIDDDDDEDDVCMENL